MKWKWNYVLRHVTAGGKTVEEADDDVQFITVTDRVAKSVVLVPKNQTEPTFFGVATEDKPDEPLWIQLGQNPTPLCFDSYTEALDFVAYLYAMHPPKIGSATFGRCGLKGIEPLKAKDFSNLTLATCKPASD